MRSTSVLNPTADGDPVPASDRAVKLISPKKVTRGDSADVMCSTNWPRVKPRAPSGRFVVEKLRSPNPAIFRLGYSRASPGVACSCGMAGVFCAWATPGNTARRAASKKRRMAKILAHWYWSRQRREHFFIEILRTFHAVEGTGFVFQCERALEAAGQHDANASLHVVLVAPAIPVLRMDVRRRVGCECLESVEEHVLVLPVAEVRRHVAVGMVDRVHQDAKNHRVGGKAPVVFERHLDAEVAAEVGHLPVRLDGRVYQRNNVEVPRITVTAPGNGIRPNRRPERL